MPSCWYFHYLYQVLKTALVVVIKNLNSGDIIHLDHHYRPEMRAMRFGTINDIVNRVVYHHIPSQYFSSIALLFPYVLCCVLCCMLYAACYMLYAICYMLYAVLCCIMCIIICLCFVIFGSQRSSMSVPHFLGDGAAWSDACVHAIHYNVCCVLLIIIPSFLYLNCKQFRHVMHGLA